MLVISTRSIREPQVGDIFAPGNPHYGYLHNRNASVAVDTFENMTPIPSPPPWLPPPLWPHLSAPPSPAPPPRPPPAWILDV
ncbi:hypothetical protein L198_07471 [Cryptococcus wingfieldii CBS 7118]|uniref:Uncharacterized protein n=1 Tax=Cryptococcus wingfieldii CBS 7118 TaxID=1295528 RepID=A0A1E3IBC4_9TREE|nr:hypothetical protein L198_07471 [Cryptococcus wingfieldii CBS 7118]ODN85902.1 hypothetical protein L198_07471 [Cryptococcus wingfieldii CBS 7118]